MSDYAALIQPAFTVIKKRFFATEITEVFSFVGAALAANNPSDRDEFAAKAAPAFTVVQIKTTKQVLASVFSVSSVANRMFISNDFVVALPVYLEQRIDRSDSFSFCSLSR